MDEGRNRVVIGIDRSTATAQRPLFAEQIGALRIPTGAVVIEETKPVVLTSTLQDYIHPQPSGVEVDFFRDGNTLPCTLGFNVSFEKGEGFITCSHCTQTWGQLDGDSVGYGVEERDPEYTSATIGCPPFRRCRNSDSALIYYAFVNEQGDGAHIARPEASVSCPTTGTNITIDAMNPRLTVTGTQNAPLLGQSAEKIGRTTGWSTGTVTQTCVDINITADMTQLCSDAADFGPVIAGDSGSPVFHQTQDGAVIDGILWGTVTNTCTAYFSHFSAIKYDLGPFSP
jgi:hypothetical protein